MWILRLKPQETPLFAGCSSGGSLCFTLRGQLRWHHHEWMKPGVKIGFSCGICRNMVLGKDVSTRLMGADSLVPVHRNCLYLFFLVYPPHSCVMWLLRELEWAGCRCSYQACAMTILKNSALLAPPVHWTAMPQPKVLPKTTSIIELSGAGGPPVPKCHLHEFPEPFSSIFCCSYL